MAFNINAQIILQAPNNVKAITSSIQSQLQGVSVNVVMNIPKNVQQQLNLLNTSLKQLNQGNQNVSNSGKQAGNTLNNVGQSAKNAGGAMHMLGKETALTFKRFAAAGLVTATFFRMTQAISEAIPKALEFQREMVRLEQITGNTAKQLNTVSKAIRNLSTSLGVDANELANVAKLFAQTGQSIKEVQASLLAVARSSLAPTFGEMAQTAEGLIAALNQFNIKASESEAVLGSLNRVSKKFAVESSDLIAAIRRAGGVFAIAAGDIKKPIQALQEFTAIFTAVRSTTRESAETVATGLRTIFTRLQRRGTIDALKALGINLTDVDGKFIGLFQSFRILSTELDKIIQKGDAITLSGITEELGGMRQVGKLIPAIQEFKKAEQALLEAKKGAQEGLGGDVAKGLTPLIKQFELVRERFNEFIRVIADSSAFSSFAKTALGIANAFLSLGEAITPILPALTALAAIKISKSLGGFASGFFGSFGGGGGMKAAGQTAGGAVTGGGKGAASTASSTQAMGNLVGALGTNSNALGTSNTHLGNLNTTLGSLKGMITPLKTALSNLTRAVSVLGPTAKGIQGTPGMRAPSSAVGGTQAVNFAPLQTALAAHTTALASNTTNLATMNTSLSSLKSPLGSIKGSLTTVKTALNNLKGALTQKGSSAKLAAAMGTVTKSLGANTRRLGMNTTKLGNVNTRLGTNTKALGVNTTRLGTNTKALGTNTAKLGTNTAKLGTVTKALGTVTKALGTHTTKLGANTTKLGANTTKLGTVNTKLGANTKSLGANTRRLGATTKALGVNTAKLGTNTTKLGTVNTKLGVVTKALGTTTARLGTNTTALGTNTTRLGTNTASLGTMATALNALKVVIGPVQTALINLTAAINSLKAIMMTKGSGGAMGNIRGRGTGMRGPRRFATGGLVPGSGNRDTVPAMLTPGEFVVRKSAVNSVGTGALGQINGYNKGGKVDGNVILDPMKLGIFNLSPQNPDGTIPAYGKAKITNLAAIQRLEGKGGKGKAVDRKSLSNREAGAFLKGSINSQAKALGIKTAGLGKSAIASAVATATGVNRTVKADGGKGDQLSKSSGSRTKLMKKFAGSKGKLFSKRALRSGGFSVDEKDGVANVNVKGQLSTFSPTLQEHFAGREDAFEKELTIILQQKVKQAITDTANSLAEDFLLGPVKIPIPAVRDRAISSLLTKGSGAMTTMTGFILEGIIGSLTGAIVGGNQMSFDFYPMNALVRDNLANLFVPNEKSRIASLVKADAKKTFSTKAGDATNKDGVAKKVINDVNRGNFAGVNFQKFAAGGTAQGSDTVPAMLTPGEYVVNKGAAQAFGYGNLKNINRYQAGGVVKRSRSHYGTGGLPKGVTQTTTQSNLPKGYLKNQANAKNLGKNFKSLASASLNAFFGLQSLMSGLEELNSETGLTTMGMVNLGFGISMMAPAIGALGKVITSLSSWLATMSGMGAVFTVAWTKLTTYIAAAGPMMQGIMIAGVGLALGFLADKIADWRLGKKKSIGKTGDIKGRTGVSAQDVGSADAWGGALQGAGIAAGVTFALTKNVGAAAVAGIGGGIIGAQRSREKGTNQQADFLLMEKLIVSQDKLVDIQTELEKASLLTVGEMHSLAIATDNLSSTLISSGLGTAGFNDVGAMGLTSQDVVVSAGLEEMKNGFVQLVATITSFDQAGSITGPEDVEEYVRDATGPTDMGGAGETRFKDKIFDDEFIIGEVKGITTLANKIFSEIDMQALAQQTKNSVDLTFKSLGQAVDQLSSADLTSLPNDIDGAMTAMRALGIDTTTFTSAIESAVNISLVNKAAELSSGSTEDKATSVAFAILTKKAGEMGQTVSGLAETMDPAAFSQFAEEAGIIGPALTNGANSIRLLAIEERKRLEKDIPNQVIMMRKLAKAEALANSAMNTFVSSFSRFSGAVTKGAQVFTNFADSLGSFADNLGGPQFDVRAQINPFEDLDNSSTKELGDAIDRILSFAGTQGSGPGFEGIKETVAVQKALPDVLREVTIEALEAPKAQTPAELGTMLEGKIKKAVTDQGLDADKIPPVVLESLRASIQGLVGNREDAAGTSEDELKRLFESEDFTKIMEEFGDATGPVIEALSEMHDAVNEVGTAQINLLSIQTDFIHKEIEARLQSIDVINKTSDALNKFRPGGGPKDTVARAEARLLQRQQGILGAPTNAASTATIDVNQQQARVERLRDENRRIRQDMADAGGPVIGADVTPGAAGTFNAAAIESDQAALLENSQQLTAHEKALQNLINSTDMLDATMAELSDIEKSRMDARQIAQFEAKRMSRVLNETDPVKRAKLMQEQYAGDQAFNKLQAGGALSPQDIAALIDGGLERRLAIGVASGDITKEQAEGRRAQFNKFLSETALPGMNQMLGGPFNGPAMEQLQNATALGGTAQGTTTKEKDLIIKAEEEARKKKEAIEKDFANKQSGFNMALKNAADQLGDFTTAVENAAIRVNDANKEMQDRLDKAKALREAGSGPRPGDGAEITDADALDFATEAETAAAASLAENEAIDAHQIRKQSEARGKENELVRVVAAAELTEAQDAANNIGGSAEPAYKRASREAREELADFRTENQALLDAPMVARTGEAQARNLGTERVAQEKIDEMVADGDVTRGQASVATMAVEGDDLVKQVQRLIQSIKMVDELMQAGGALAGGDRDAILNQIIAGTFSATAPGVAGAAGVTDPALKPLEDMSQAMLNPGSIYVHDVYVEKLLMEIVKLLGGSEEHLKRAKVAAEKELAGLKSPTGRQGTVTGNLQEQAAAMKSAAGMPKAPPEMQATVDKLVEQLDSGTLQEGGTPAQKAEAKAMAREMGAGDGFTSGKIEMPSYGDVVDNVDDVFQTYDDTEFGLKEFTARQNEGQAATAGNMVGVQNVEDEPIRLGDKKKPSPIQGVSSTEEQGFENYDQVSGIRSSIEETKRKNKEDRELGKNTEKGEVELERLEGALVRNKRNFDQDVRIEKQTDSTAKTNAREAARVAALTPAQRAAQFDDLGDGFQGMDMTGFQNVEDEPVRKKRSPPARSAFDTNVAGTGASKVKDETKVPEPEADNKMMKELNRRADEEIVRNQVIMDNRKKSGEFDSGASSPLDTTYQDARNKIREENRLPEEDFASNYLAGKNAEESNAATKVFGDAVDGMYKDLIESEGGEATPEAIRSRKMLDLTPEQRATKVSNEQLAANMIKEGAGKGQSDMSTRQTRLDAIDSDPDLTKEDKLAARRKFLESQDTIGEKETGLSQKQKTDALEAQTANVLRKRTQESVTTFGGGAEVQRLTAAEDRMREVSMNGGGTVLEEYMPGLGHAVQEGRTDFGRAGATGALGMRGAATRITSGTAAKGDLKELQTQRQHGRGVSDDDLTFDVLGLGDKGLLGSKNKGDIGPKQKALALLQANEAEKMKRQNVLYEQFMASKKARADFAARGGVMDGPDDEVPGGSDEEDRAIFDRESAKIEESKFYGSEFMTPDQIAEHKRERSPAAAVGFDRRELPETLTGDKKKPQGGMDREKIAKYVNENYLRKMYTDQVKDEETGKWSKSESLPDVTAETLTGEHISKAIQHKASAEIQRKAKERREMEEAEKKRKAEEAAAQKTAAEAATAAATVAQPPRTEHTPESQAAYDTLGMTPQEMIEKYPDMNPVTMQAGAVGVQGASGAMGAAGGAAGGGEGGVNIRTLVDAINSLNQVTVNVAVADINVILNTGGLADKLRGVIAAEALIALEKKIGPTLKAEVIKIVQGLDA